MGMRGLRRRSAVAAAAALALAIGSPAVGAPSGPGSNARAAMVAVQTYNLDAGADLTPLYGALDPLVAASMVWAQAQLSDIPGRAQAVAEVIAQEAPDLVGLQEVSTWRSAPAEFTGSTFEAVGEFTTEYEVLDLLLDELASLGTPYEMVAATTNFSNGTFPLPAVTGSGLRMVTFTDRDVILARSSSLAPGPISVVGTGSGTYEATLLVRIAGDPVVVPRGWAAADVAVAGVTFRFVTTHLEAHGSTDLKDDIRNPQAQELAALLGASPYPVVIVGDFNARPTMCRDARWGAPEWVADQDVAAYGYLEAAGLAEVWPTIHPDDPCGPAGWTSWQERLSGISSTLTHRVDHVFASEDVTVIQAEVVGDELADRTQGGLWPSDHASVWAEVRLGDSELDG
jgi:endonuclease/exonuclease/phosphatase family metal-dependent hydrolase